MSISVRRLLLFLPLAAFVLIAVFLFIGLFKDPQNIPSALLNEPVPEFELAGIDGRETGLQGLSRETILDENALQIVNIFASWCVPCRIEHPLIMQLADQGYKVHGINYKDKPDAALQWLEDLGDPYTRVGADETGRAGIEWGVYGVPETFIIDASGQVVYKHVGPISPPVLNTQILPILQSLAP